MAHFFCPKDNGDRFEEGRQVWALADDLRQTCPLSESINLSPSRRKFMQKEELLTSIRDRVSNIFNENGIELVGMTYRREGGIRVLRILADTETGITVDECAKMNEIIGEALDREDFINEKYVLEISSPGLDRPLKTKKDFARVKGKRIRVYTFAPVDEKKEFVGAMEAVDESSITVSSDSAKFTKIPIDKISKATLDFNFRALSEERGRGS